MISINSRGDFAHGVGGGFLSLNNQPLIRGGVMGFMDDDTIAFASGADQIDGEWIASAYDLKTGTTRRLNPDNPTGANSGAAGGGIAAWWWAKSGPNYGLHSTAGLRLPNAGLFTVSPDGAVAYKPDFHADGPSVVRERDESEWTLTPNHAWNLCLVGTRRAAWIDSSDLLLRVANLPTPQTLASKINFPTPFLLGGAWWLGYWSEGYGLVAHPFDDPNHGYRFVAPGVDAWPAFRALSDTQLCCVWSDHIAEQAGHLTKVLRDVRQDPLEQIDLGLPSPNIDAYDRPLPHFWYYTLDADKGYGDYFEEILDACWCATESDVAKANEQGAYVIAGADKVRKAMKPALVMVSNDFGGAPPLDRGIDDAMPVARELNVGMLIVDEHDWQTFPANIPDGAVLGFKAFREPTETAIETLERLLPVTARCQTAGHRVCWVLGADDRLRTLTDFQISETLQTLTSVFAELSNVAIVGAFSYARRGTMPDGRPTGGALLHPNAAEWVRASRRAGSPFSWDDYRLTPEEPEEQHMAAIGPRLADTFTAVKEIPQPDGTVALELPPDKKGKRKIKATTPDGQDQVRPEEDRDWQPSDIGPWEVYKKTPTAYVAERDKNRTYVYPRA